MGVTGQEQRKEGNGQEQGPCFTVCCCCCCWRCGRRLSCIVALLLLLLLLLYGQEQLQLLKNCRARDMLHSLQNPVPYLLLVLLCIRQLQQQQPLPCVAHVPQQSLHC
jgi:hypothetical protein